MKISLSNRLLACCSFVAPGDRVVDVGCDHGYLGIHLLLEGIASFVVASDVNEQPLESALHNAYKFGVQGRMSFYQSDGVHSIPRDFDSMVCAGIGADTIISIMEAAPWLKDRKYRLILQCQSRRPQLRKYLNSNGFRIRQETLAKDGKFIYPIMEAVYDPGEVLSPAQFHISPALLDSGSDLLPAFYRRVVCGIETTVKGLSHSGSEKLAEYQEILQELKEMEEKIHDNRC